MAINEPKTEKPHTRADMRFVIIASILFVFLDLITQKQVVPYGRERLQDVV